MTHNLYSNFRHLILKREYARAPQSISWNLNMFMNLAALKTADCLAAADRSRWAELAGLSQDERIIHFGAAGRFAPCDYIHDPE